MRFSKIKPTFNYPALKERFEVWVVETENEKIPRDFGLLRSDACDAVANHFKLPRCYFLFNKDVNAKKIVADAIKDAVAAKIDTTLSANKVEIEKLPQHILLNLLLCSLNKPESISVDRGNVTGHLYVVHPKYCLRDCVYALDISVTKNLHLSLKAITFTKLSYFLKKGFVPFDESKKVRFCLDCGQLYKAPKDAPLDDIYVLRKKNNNAQIPFLDFGNRTYFEKSKLGMLDSVLRIFDERYKDVCQIEFENLETAAVCNDVANPKGKENPKWLAQLGKMFDGKTIGIKNYAEEPLDAAIAMLASKVERRSGASVVIGETGDACIKIVESREFYEAHPDIKDPYGVDEGVAVQHITKETLLDDAEGAYSCADVFIKEMAIKRDIKNQFMGTLDWPSFGLKGSWVFYRFVRRHKKDESDEYWRLEISEEGKLSFSNVLDENSFEWEYAGELEKVNDGNCNYAVIASDGSINRIYEEYDTGVALFAVPDFKTIGDKLRRGETISRSADGRAAYLQESIDVAYAPIDERSAYFYSGVIGKGMQSSLARAALLRRIVAVGESRLLIDELLPLMDVDIVRLRNTTVIPFPFKYLREYCASLTPKSN